MARFEIWISENGWSNLDYFILVDTIECTGSCEYTLTGLSSDTRYWIMIREVQGISDEIKGAFSTPIELRTLYIPPNGWNVLLSVDDITYTNIHTSTNSTTYTIEDLSPATTYYVKIETVGYNEFSNTISFETPGLPTPIPKENVQGELVIGGSFPYKYTFKQDTVSNKTTVSFRCRTDTLKEVFFIEGDVND